LTKKKGSPKNALWSRLKIIIGMVAAFTALVTAITGLIVVLGPIFARDNGDGPPPENHISIIRPEDGDSVGQFVVVEYRVHGELQGGYDPIVLVRGPDGPYHSWGTFSSGLHLRVQIGTEVDAGEEFEIGVLVTDEQIEKDEVRQRRPAGIEYDSVTVTRRYEP